MTDTQHLPATEPEASGVEPARPLPGRFTDTARALAQGQAAVDHLNAADPDDDENDSDGELVLLPGHRAVGNTPGAALRRAAAFCDQASHLSIDSVTLARMPGSVEGTWEFHAILVFAAVDPVTGETGSTTHHGYPKAGKRQWRD